MPRGEESAAGAEGMVLAGMDSMGSGGGGTLPNTGSLVVLGAVLGRAVPRLFSAEWVARPDPWFSPCPLLSSNAEAPPQGLCATSESTK